MLEPLQARFLQADSVVVIEVVQAGDGVAARQSLFTEVIANKAGGAGDQDMH